MKNFLLLYVFAQYCFLLVTTVNVEKYLPKLWGQKRIWQFCKTLSEKMNARLEMAFLGYTYENADTSEILEYTRQEELAAAYPFAGWKLLLMQEVMKSMLLFQDLIVRSVFIRLRLRKKGNIWKI